MLPLFRRHSMAASTRYRDVAQTARTQTRLLQGTPGTLRERTKGAIRFLVRQYIRVDGVKTDEYVGSLESLPVGTREALEAGIAQAQMLASASSELRVLGFQRIDRKPAAALVAIHNAGLFEAGLTLVGSHAFGVLLNELGIAISAYRTRDVDLARGAPLNLALPADRDFLAILRDSGLEFLPVPGFPSSTPSSSYKLPGAEDLLVDLLVPDRSNRVGGVVPVPELRAHAQTIPWLAFLVSERLHAVVLSPNQVVPVSVPAPERFIVHKLISSQTRRQDLSKSSKDLEQAAVLAAALEDELPGRLQEGFDALPQSARSLARTGAARAVALLGTAHKEAAEVLHRNAGPVRR